MQTTAIVGYSGCGKSTIMNLVARLHDPQHGQIVRYIVFMGVLVRPHEHVHIYPNKIEGPITKNNRSI